MKNWTLRFRAADRAIFEQVKRGEKTIETRAATVKYRSVQAGDELIFVCGTERFSKRIAKLHQWPSVDAMVAGIPFKQVMPGVVSVEEMKRVYASFPGYEEKIREHGLLGFELA